MGTVLHRTTKEIRRSINTPDYPPADWLVNPDLSAVDGHPVSRWVIDGDVVRLPNESELPAIEAAELAAAKAAKMESINAKTSALIEAGSVTVNGVAISTALTNQVSLQAIDTLVGNGIATYPQPISATDGTQYAITSQADMDRVGGIVATFVMTKKAQGRTLRAQVLACTTVAQVEAVEDNR